MRILILGNNYSAKAFFKRFKENKENIVFTNMQNCNYIELANLQDTIDFCQANDVNLVLIIDEDFINQGYQEALSANNISVFCPSIEAISITTSKSWAKKFMHKNKILTPKFFIAEKTQTAIDYLKTAQMPQAIKPENNSFQECPKFIETQKQAQEAVNELFASGNKKIIIEDYIEGKNFSIWVLSDGYSAKIIGKSAKYQNNIALFEPDFLEDELIEKIYRETIMPTISALCEQEEEYIGILGFDFILSYKNEPYLIGYNSFFDEINVNFFTKGYEIEWEKIFDSTIIGDVFQKFSFEPKNEYMLSIRQKDKINFIHARTKNRLEEYLNTLDFDLSEYCEAKKIWKY